MLRIPRGIASLVVLGLLLSACGDSDDATGEPAADSLDDAAEDPPEAQMKSLRMAQTIGITYSHLPRLANQDRLAEEGWDIEDIEFNSQDLIMEAVAGGVVDIARAQVLDAIQLVQAGGDVVILAEDRPEEFVMITPADIEDCAELDGKSFGIHSEGSAFTAINDYYVRENCDGATIDRLVMAGGENRIVAMANNQLDATLGQLSNFITLDDREPGRFHILAVYGQDLDDLAGGVIVANRQWANENRDLAVEYLAELLRDLRAANEDVANIRQASQDHQSEDDQAVFDRVHEAYKQELGGFPDDGGITLDSMAFMIDLFEGLDLIDPGLTPEEVFDPTILSDALETAEALGPLP